VSLFVLFKGFFLALSTIMPIGSQNAMILKQGMYKEHHLMSAALFILYDAVLISLGVLTGSLLLASNDIVFTSLTWAGIIFLFAYGLLAFKNVVKQKYHSDNKLVVQKSLWRIVIIGFLVTFLNPHVYIDTVMIIGSVGGQYKGLEQYAFISGAILASFVWFSTLALTAAKLSTQLTKPKVQMIVDGLIGIIMWVIAALLFTSWLNS
jgi:L-lysine exporter family protein LysE/ArgO